MRSNKQWKVQQLLRLAELCDSEEGHKRKMYMDEAERLIFEIDEDGSELPTLISKGDGIQLFLEHCEEEGISIVGRWVRDVYNAYVEFCELNDIEPVTQHMLTSRVKGLTGYNTRSMRLNGTVVRGYANH